MFPRSHINNQREALTPLAAAMADAFEHAGDSRAATQGLSLVSRHGISDGVALRRAEQAFAVGDATAALNALIPAWEAGSEDLHLEVRMGLASLALGLYDVVETLTDQDTYSLEHSVLRWLAAVSDDFETPELDWERAETVWITVTMLKTLVQCGRSDIVYRVGQVAVEDGLSGLHQSIRSLPAQEPAVAKACSPPLHGREDFKDDWELPAGDIVFNWLWTSARQAFTGERLLTVGLQADLFGRFLEHVSSDHILDPPSTESTGYVNRLKPGRYDHIVSIFDLNRGLAPSAVLADYARGLTHEGQLHLLVAGPNLAHSFDLCLSKGAVERLCEEVGLKLVGSDSRDETGLPASESEADVYLIRVEKRII